MRRNRTRSRSSAGLRGDDRAVSEVLSFVLIFGIIMTSVAVLSMTGFQAMDDYQRTEQLRNAEHAMGALADNFNDVLRYDGIDRRYGELALREGTVTVGSGGTEINVSVDGEPVGNRSAFSSAENETITLGTFRYEYGSETIAYEGGGVVRAGESGSVVLEEPLLTCRDETAIVSLVRVDADNRSIQSGDGLGFTMRVEDRTSEVYPVEDNVTITVTDTPYDGAWASVEDAEEWTDCTPNRVQVTVVTVDVEY